MKISLRLVPQWFLDLNIVYTQPPAIPHHVIVLTNYCLTQLLIQVCCFQLWIPIFSWLSSFCMVVCPVSSFLWWAWEKFLIFSSVSLFLFVRMVMITSKLFSYRKLTQSYCIKFLIFLKLFAQHFDLFHEWCIFSIDINHNSFFVYLTTLLKYNCFTVVC